MLKKLSLCMALLLSLTMAVSSAFATVTLSDTPDPNRVTVLNPRGLPAGIPLNPMAERATPTLDGRPLYLIDVRFMDGDKLLFQLRDILAEKYPDLEVIFRYKYGGYTEDDPDLWNEIKERNGVALVSIGH